MPCGLAQHGASSSLLAPRLYCRWPKAVAAAPYGSRAACIGQWWAKWAGDRSTAWLARSSPHCALNHGRGGVDVAPWERDRLVAPAAVDALKLLVGELVALLASQLQQLLGGCACLGLCDDLGT